MMIATPEKHPTREPNALRATCRSHRLLQRDEAGIVRVPFLVRGKLVVPEEIDRSAIERAFEERDRDRPLGRGPATYAAVGNAQILREPIIDRTKMARTGQYQYTVMPALSPEAVIETDDQALAAELYALPFDEIETFIRCLARTIDENR